MCRNQLRPRCHFLHQRRPQNLSRSFTVCTKNHQLPVTAVMIEHRLEVINLLYRHPVAQRPNVKQHVFPAEITQFERLTFEVVSLDLGHFLSNAHSFVQLERQRPRVDRPRSCCRSCRYGIGNQHLPRRRRRTFRIMASSLGRRASHVDVILTRRHIIDRELAIGIQMGPQRQRICAPFFHLWRIPPERERHRAHQFRKFCHRSRRIRPLRKERHIADRIRRHRAANAPLNPPPRPTHVKRGRRSRRDLYHVISQRPKLFIRNVANDDRTRHDLIESVMPVGVGRGFDIVRHVQRFPVAVAAVPHQVNPLASQNA